MWCAQHAALAQPLTVVTQSWLLNPFHVTTNTIRYDASFSTRTEKRLDLPLKITRSSAIAERPRCSLFKLWQNISANYF